MANAISREVVTAAVKWSKTSELAAGLDPDAGNRETAKKIARPELRLQLRFIVEDAQVRIKSFRR